MARKPEKEVVRWTSGTRKFRGLKTHYGGKRPSELSEEQKGELKAIIEERDDWTTKGVRELIREKFGVEYSLRHR